MLRRKIETQLEAWRSAPKRTALLVTGARQIGKTYIIRHFAQQHYDHIAELNFIENPDLVALFDRPRDAKNLLMRLEPTIIYKELNCGDHFLATLDLVKENQGFAGY